MHVNYVPKGRRDATFSGEIDDQWLLSFNPIFNMDLSDKVSRQPRFEPALKVTHAVGQGLRAGLEYMVNTVR